MIIPKQVTGRHKIRDAKIIRLYSLEHKTLEEIGKHFNLTKPRIWKIIHNNKELLEIDKNFEKVKRYHALSRELTNSEPSKKDRLEILAEMRRELEDGSKNTGNTTINSISIGEINSEAVRSIIDSLRARVIPERTA